jgi:hypothetical protein
MRRKTIFDKVLKDSLEGLIGAVIGSLIVLTVLGIGLFWYVSSQPDITPVSERYGLAEYSSDYTQEAFGEYPEAFSVEGGREDNKTRNVRLWEPLLTKSPNWRNERQPIGDCVAASLCNGIQMLAARRGETVDPFRPYTYGLARVTYGNNRPGCGSDGAVASWAVKGFVNDGWLERVEAHEPYNAKSARDWGCKGPPQQYLDIAKGRTGSAYPVRSADELIDSLANGFPCTIAGMFGTKEETIKKQDNRWVASWNDRWPHQMLFCGYDGSGSTAYVYLLNSWGDDWPLNKSPLQNEIKGGVWVTIATATRMIKEGECWALSDVKGFKINPGEVDWSVFDARVTPPSPFKKEKDHYDVLATLAL